MTVAAVTPRGVREGQREALEGLVARRGPAVLAYCSEVCSGDVAPRAAAEAFARFRAAVHDAPDLAAVDPESLLVSATRHAAASFAPQPPLDPQRRGRSAKAETCALVPMLLAARAAGALGPADRDRLARHLQRCESCRQTEAAFLRAERAYRHPPKIDIPRATGGLLVAALTAAAPVGPLLDEAEPDVVDDALERPGDTAESEALAATTDAPAELDGPESADPAQAGEAGLDLALDDVLDADDALSDIDDEDEYEYEYDPEPGADEHAAATEPATGVIALPHTAQHEAEHSRISPVPRRAPSLPALPRVPARIALPVGVVLAAVVIALAAAGVFSGGDPTPEATNPAAANRRPDAPVLTPLPVRVSEPGPATTTPTQTTPETPPETTPGDEPVPPAGTAPPAPPGDTGDAGSGAAGDSAGKTDGTRGGTGGAGAGGPADAPVFEETPAGTTP